jgi:Holliday junction resolvasome RuvABC endonuclease subunit
MILGLDISSSIVGWCVIDNTKILDYGSWDLRNKNKYDSLFKKGKKVQEELKLILSKFPNLKFIFIEKSLQSFRSGFSSAQTLSTLATFNGIVSWLCYELIGQEPNYLSAPSARKSIGIKIEKGQNAKEIVVDYLIKTEPSFSVALTKFGNYQPDTFDKADAIVIAKAGELWNKKNLKS